MQAENCYGGQELLCINTEKVYDWILNESIFDLNLNALELPPDPQGTPYTCADIDLDGVTCSVEPAAVDPIVILDRTDQHLVIDGTEVTLQLVNIRKTFDVTVYANLSPALGGGQIEIATVQFSRCEQVILCAPEGTDIDVEYTDFECYICTANCDITTTPNELNVTATIRLCQSIQSTYEVTLEIMADFCEPREMLPVPSCPSPTKPPQCPVVFPTAGSGYNR
ncbi:hypothetical protein CAI16_18700 [Virgibacillus dokdonensis]|uniref:Uncharacterized protein n=1 Tax=Virgibacillus dokdonensis TaxID=302167 RepID=A0A3E0WJF1_9BACI|nr:hypothetical protein [Virgibacillus dokdonensis]RFA32227.1 hypothetical protein CAI16_18700 [Virgibacillus dokdonensis]